MYTIKSISGEGIWYLVRGWNQHKRFWVKWTEVTPDKLFKKPGYAFRSLKRLLKIMPEYKRDKFVLVFTDNPGAGEPEEVSSYRSYM